MDFTDKFNTSLSDTDERKFGDWIAKQRDLVGRDLSADLADYDLRGWWKKHDGKNVGDEHLTDEFKKPNHPTFSDESKYNGNGLRGGKWGKDGDMWTFTPGPTNMQLHGDALPEYFERFEPNAKLIMPNPAADTLAGGAMGPR